MEPLPPYITELINKIAKSEHFTDYTITISAGSNHGLSGLIAAILVQGTRTLNGLDQQDKLHLLCKFGSGSAKRREEFQTAPIFRREIFVYEKLMPTFAQFQREKGLTERESFLAYPKYYLGVADDDTEQFAVIMEDLRVNQFVMWPKHRSVPLDHVRLLMEQLGRFHGTALALKSQRPQVFEEFAELNDMLGSFYRNTLPMFLTAYDVAISVLDDDQQIKVLQDAKANGLKYLENYFVRENFEPFGVIGHGDCWTNNIMYQYDAEIHKTASSVNLVDWQLARYGSPVLDLISYIFTSTDKQLRDSDFVNLINLYHASLSDHVRRLGSDPEELYNYATFRNQLKLFGKIAIILAPITIQFLLADSSDLADLDELSVDLKGDKGAALVKELNGSAQSAYKTRVKDVVSDILALDLYWNDFGDNV